MAQSTNQMRSDSLQGIIIGPYVPVVELDKRRIRIIVKNEEAMKTTDLNRLASADISKILRRLRTFG